jgi:hypothetical protein
VGGGTVDGADVAKMKGDENDEGQIESAEIDGVEILF